MDETTQTADATIELHNTDWKAEARKWEGRAKENATARAELDELKASSAEQSENLKKALAEIESMKAEQSKLAVEKQRAEIAAETGVPANLISGTTAEEMKASADAISAFAGSQRRAPVTNEQGGKNMTASPITKADIAAIKNPKERIEAIMAHQELF